jgi:CubicO group peptidase (beta-lactamase class C family)
MGVVVMVSKDGLLVYQGAAGFADKEAGRPMTADAVFRLASVSKAYTTMAAGALIGRGVIGIDEPIGTYLPAFSGSNAELKDKRALGIKVRHLLSHQAGFNYTFGESPGGPYHAAGVADGCQDSPGLSLDENMLRLSRTPLLYAPGTKHAYSVASDVLGAVIQNATGKPLPDAMDELVLSPLGITDTGYLAKDPGKLTAHYRSRPGGPRRMAEPELFGIGGGKTLTLSPKRATDPTEFPSGGCGMVGSAPSLMVLLEAMREDGGGIVEPAVMSGFYQDAIAPQRNSPGEGFGASWAVVLNPAAAGLPVSAGTIHWGGVYGHNWYVDRENGLSVVILTNTALKGLNGDTKDRALTAIYKAYPKGK